MAKKNNGTDKMNSSIARRLNAQLFYKMLGVFISLDLVITAIFFAGTMVYVEKSFVAIEEVYGNYTDRQLEGDKEQEFEILQALGYNLSVSQGGAEKKGFSFDEKQLKNMERIKSIKYNKNIEIANNEELSIALSLGKGFYIFCSGMIILFIWEIIVLLAGLGKNLRLVRRTLRPLDELSMAANLLNNIAGTLDSINANQLDTRIPDSLAKDELRVLAGAINGMLDRIDAAYHSQMRFVSDASHELRTPIAVIQGYASILDRWGKDDPDTVEEAIDAIQSEANGMKEMVEQLLFLARGDNESMHLEFETLDLGKLLSNVLKEMEMIDKNHLFRLNMEDGVCINGDEGLIKQLMRILIDNSMKYTPVGGNIMVSVKSTDHKAILTVQDEGRGIKPEAVPYIFDRFYRADESRARKTGGTGLGLSIAKWIIGRHNGIMEVVSREGVGTRFTVELERVEG